MSPWRVLSLLSTLFFLQLPSLLHRPYQGRTNEAPTYLYSHKRYYNVYNSRSVTMHLIHLQRPFPQRCSQCQAADKRFHPLLGSRRYHSRTVRTMAGKVLTANVDTFEAGVSELVKAPAPHYIVFTTDNDPSTGKPWCPDCVRAVPPIQAVAARSPGTLMEVTVGPRSAWKGNPSHPFRVDPQLKLTGVPTLLAWGPSGATRRLGPELEACNSSAEVEKLLSSTGFFSP